MKVVIIGITGRLGTRIASELKALDIEILGLNRRPERVATRLQTPGIKTIACDAADENLAQNLIGADVLVLATAPTRENPQQFPFDAQNVIDACKAAGVKRIVALTNHMALTSPDGRPMLEAKPPHPFFYDIEACFADEAEIFRNEKELSWLLIAPPIEVIPYGEQSKQVHVEKEKLQSMNDKISMDDFAWFVAQQVVAPKYDYQLIAVSGV